MDIRTYLIYMKLHRFSIDIFEATVMKQRIMLKHLVKQVQFLFTLLDGIESQTLNIILTNIAQFFF